MSMDKLKGVMDLTEIINVEDFIKFDAAVGNPPYQLSVSSRPGHSDITVNIFPDFQNVANIIANKISLIYPYLRWWVRDSQLKKEFKKIDGLKSVIYFIEKEGPPVFTGVGVSDGINIVHIDKTKKNTNSIKWISGNTDESILVTNESINSIMPSRVTELKIIEKHLRKSLNLFLKEMKF